MKKPTKNQLMKDLHQRIIDCLRRQSNLHKIPCVFDPFAIDKAGATLSTHHHGDHIDENVSATVTQNCGPGVNRTPPVIEKVP